MITKTLIALCLTVTFVGLVNAEDPISHEENGQGQEQRQGRGLITNALHNLALHHHGLGNFGLLGGLFNNYHRPGGLKGNRKGQLQNKLKGLEAATNKVKDLLTALEQEEAEAAGGGDEQKITKSPKQNKPQQQATEKPAAETPAPKKE